MGFWATRFFAPGFWAPGFWAGAEVPIVVEDTHDGGNRIRKQIDYYRENKAFLKRALNVAIYGEQAAPEIETEINQAALAMPYMLSDEQIERLVADIATKVQKRIALRKNSAILADDDEAITMLLLH